MSPLHNRTMQSVYLALAVIGYLAPGVPMVVESARSGNLIWVTREARRIGVGHVWLFWLLTLLLGLGGTLPLFLYVRERRLQKLDASVRGSFW